MEPRTETLLSTPDGDISIELSMGTFLMSVDRSCEEVDHARVSN